MQITYDPAGDAVAITFRDVPVEHTEEIGEGVYADYDAQENVVGIEILDASKRMDRADGIDFRILTEASLAGKR